MTGSAPSITAQRTAMRRAAHQVHDNPRVFEDPLALAIIGEEAAARLNADGRLLRAFMAARARYAEDELEAAVARGATQYVVLGAGLDTFAYRNTRCGVQVFEVDHPATQAWKREQLAGAGLSIPSSLTFVPTDFEKQTLAAALEEAGFGTDQVTFFSWLGVTPYLTAETVVATLGFIGSRPAGSGVAFDYAVERSSLDAGEHLALDALASRVARAGEPFRLFLNPEALTRMLKMAGFGHVEDLCAAEIDERYFKGRADGLQVAAGLAHLASARV